jgi:4-hydroxybenzoate polyprenyltransferase
MDQQAVKADSMQVPLRAIFDFFLFSSLYIALCAVIMVYQTDDLFHLEYPKAAFYGFVFFSTICSYNFHWYLTPVTQTELVRTHWTQKHRRLHLLLYVAGLIGAGYFVLQLLTHWLWLSGAVLLTFLYSAPKIPYKPFTALRKVAVGKTIFLAFVWMYVTTFLPVMIAGVPFGWDHLLFCISRFFLIYSICIIFDYRDRENDRREGIKSMITFFNEKGIDRLFFISLSIFAGATVSLYFAGISLLVVLLLLLPGVLLLALYRYAKKTFSDYLYYFVLDGLMMCSALFTSFLSIYLFLKT